MSNFRPIDVNALPETFTVALSDELVVETTNGTRGIVIQVIRDALLATYFTPTPTTPPPTTPGPTTPAPTTPPGFTTPPPTTPGPTTPAPTTQPPPPPPPPPQWSINVGLNPYHTAYVYINGILYGELYGSTSVPASTTSASITVVPFSGYHFVSWSHSGPGSSAGGSNSFITNGAVGSNSSDTYTATIAPD